MRRFYEPFGFRPTTRYDCPVPAHLKRLLKPDDLLCPAASLMNDADSFCRIENGLIEGKVNPDSIILYCAGDFQSCPSWRASKEADWAKRNLLRDGQPNAEIPDNE